MVPSLLNCTVPAVTAAPPARTAAVKVTGSPVVVDVSEDDRAVVVVTALVAVVISRLQPPDIVPASPLVSSTTYKDQVPLAVLRPVNAPARVVWPEGAGAGAGKESAAPPGLAFVGR